MGSHSFPVIFHESGGRKRRKRLRPVRKEKEKEPYNSAGAEFESMDYHAESGTYNSDFLAPDSDTDNEINVEVTY